MQPFFYTTSIIGLAYFLLAKRRFDWFAVAFFSACIYFLPGFFGYTSYLSLTSWDESPINNMTYGIMIIVEVAIVSTAVLSDFFPLTKKEDNGRFRNAKAPENIYVLHALLFLAVVGLMAMLLTTGSALFDVEKQAMMDELNRWHILFYTATVVGCILAFEYKKWHIFAWFCLFILFDVLIGFRATLAITSIGIFTLWLSRQGKRRLLLSYWKPLAVGVLVVLFLFFYKQVQFAVKYGDTDLFKSIIGNPSTYSVMFMQSEPFICQSTLNEVTEQNYFVGMDHLKGVLYQFMLFTPELGLETTSFNDLFQPDLFPEVNYGMANNIWAEMWSAGGWPLLLVFVIFFVLMLKLFSVMTATGNNKTGRAVVAVMASYWAFYIHRNDIIYEISLLKRVLLVAGLSYLIAVLMKKMTNTQQISRSIAQGAGGYEKQ